MGGRPLAWENCVSKEIIFFCDNWEFEIELPSSIPLFLPSLLPFILVFSSFFLSFHVFISSSHFIT